MARTSEQNFAAASLRDKAEAALQARAKARAWIAPSEGQEALHELQVHQIELEMQNDELRLSQEHLHASLARYFDLYDLAPVGYCTLTAEGVILEANLTVSRMLGLARRELVTRSLTSFLLPADQDTYALHRQRFLEAAGPHSCELRMLRGDGSELWVQLTATDVPASYLATEAGAEGPPFSRLVLSDITELKRLEEEKTALATRLHQAERLETVGVLAMGLAHEFNNLLTGILCNAGTGGLVAEEDHDLTRLFGAIESSALKASERVQQLLAYAGRAQWALEEVDLSILVKELCQSLTISLPWNLALHCALADRVPYWQGDSTQVFQVVMNLVMNSFEAFPVDAPGEITLRTRGEHLSEVIGCDGTWILAVPPGRYAVLEVEDTGQGMTPEVLAQAFEPFFTTKATGRGLGLAAVHGLLGGHGCGLWVRSRPGRGTTFRVYLPAMAEDRATSAGEILSPWQGQGLLLVVDYDRAGRNAARTLATRCGFTVVEARGGLEAIECFRQRHGELVLVLLDRELKGTSSQEVFKVLQELDSRVPVVFTARYGWKDLGLPGGGRVETVAKPYRPAEFQGVLQRAMAGKPRSTGGLNGTKRLPPALGRLGQGPGD